MKTVCLKGTQDLKIHDITRELSFNGMLHCYHPMECCPVSKTLSVQSVSPVEFKPMSHSQKVVFLKNQGLIFVGISSSSECTLAESEFLVKETESAVPVRRSEMMKLLPLFVLLHMCATMNFRTSSLSTKSKKGWLGLGRFACQLIFGSTYLLLLQPTQCLSFVFGGKGDLHVYTMALGMYVVVVGCISKRTLLTWV